MKTHHIILTAALLFSIAIGGIVVKTNLLDYSRTEYFTIKQLTYKQVTACDEFKLKTGSLRRKQAELVISLGVIPSSPLYRNNSLYDKVRYTLTGKANYDYKRPQYFMSREDVIQVLGSPDSTSENSFFYDTGFESGVSRSLIIKFRDDYVVSHGWIELT